MPLALTGYELGLLIVALVFIAFALVVALVIPRGRPTFPGKRLPIFIAVCIALFAAQMTAVLLLAEVGEADEHVAEGGPAANAGAIAFLRAPPAAPLPPGAAASGRWRGGRPRSRQGDLRRLGRVRRLPHALRRGHVGHDRPEPRLAPAVVRRRVQQVTNGGGGMPAFKDTLSEQQIKDVAAYVSQSATG